MKGNIFIAHQGEDHREAEHGGEVESAVPVIDDQRCQQMIMDEEGDKEDSETLPYMENGVPMEGNFGMAACEYIETENGYQKDNRP